MHGSMPPPTPVYRKYTAAGGLAAGKFVRADTNGVAAGAVGFPSREEAGFGLGAAPAMGAFNYEFGHGFISYSVLFLLSRLGSYYRHISITELFLLLPPK